MYTNWTPPITSGEKSLSQDEYDKLLTVCETLEEELLLRMAVELGLRRMDISKVKIADIDIDHAKLSYFEHKKDRIRTIPLSPRLVQKIKQYLATLPRTGRRQKMLFRWGATKYGDKTAYRRLQSLKERAGIRPGEALPFHALRATCVKMKQKQGWTPEQVARLIGDTVRVVQLHYSTPSDQELQELMERS